MVEETPQGESQAEAQVDSEANEELAEELADLDPAAEYEVVYQNVLVRAAPNRDAAILGRLDLAERVRGRLRGQWLKLETWTEASPAWALVEGTEIGLGQLLRPCDVTQEESKESKESKEDEVELLDEDQLKDSKEAKQDELREVKEVEEGESKELSKVKEETQQKDLSKAKEAKAARNAVKSSLMAEKVVEAVEYTVLRRLPLYGEPRLETEVKGYCEADTSVYGFPGSLSWIRLARSPETWALIKSGKEVFLSPKWSKLKAEAVFSEAMEVSWQGVVAQKPYVAAYSIEWRLTPGEDLPIGAREGCKRSGYALSLKACTMLHGLPAGASVQLRTGVRVAAQEAGEADFRLLGSWQDFTTGSPIPPEDQDAQIDPFGGMRGGCESSQCEGYVADLDAMATVGLNSNVLNKAICMRCGKSFEAHERIDPTIQRKKAPKATAVDLPPKPAPQTGPLKTFVAGSSVLFYYKRKKHLFQI